MFCVLVKRLSCVIVMGDAACCCSRSLFQCNFSVKVTIHPSYLLNKTHTRSFPKCVCIFNLSYVPLCWFTRSLNVKFVYILFPLNLMQALKLFSESKWVYFVSIHFCVCEILTLFLNVLEWCDNELIDFFLGKIIGLLS